MNKNLLLVLGVIAALIIAGLYFGAVQAGGCCKDTNITNNYYTGTTITSGISEDELAEGLAGAAAAGSHQFDFSTQDYQGSITGAFIDSQDAVSFAVGKRWDKVGAMFHGSYTRVLDNDHLWVVGGTFRF